MASASGFQANMSTLCTLFILLSLLFNQVHGDDDGDNGNNSPPTAPVNLKATDLIVVKVWCLVILLVFTFLGGISPYFLRWNETFLLLGTQFAAGIFLGTALMHFLSDSTSTFLSVTSNDYPFSFMLASFGFVLTMLCDSVIIRMSQKSKKAAAVVVGAELGAGEEGGMDANDGRTEMNPVIIRTTSFEDTILLIIALCFHSVFEGIAIGVAGTKDDAWRNLWTIGLHKIFAAICMGIALLRMLPKRPFLATAMYALAFAVSSPIGVGIGIGIDETVEGRPADWTYAISMGIASGVFIYVAIVHLIIKGYKPENPNIFFNKPSFKTWSVVLGIAVMAVVMIWD